MIPRGAEGGELSGGMAYPIRGERRKPEEIIEMDLINIPQRDVDTGHTEQNGHAEKNTFFKTPWYWNGFNAPQLLGTMRSYGDK